MLYICQKYLCIGILVVDNVLWKGKVPELYGLTVDERHERNQQLQRKGVMALVEADKYAEAMHAFNSAVRQDPRAQVCCSVCCSVWCSVWCCVCLLCLLQVLLLCLLLCL